MGTRGNENIVAKVKTAYTALMLIDSDTAHILTRILMASTFIAASIFCVKSRNFGLACFYAISAIETYAKFRYPFHDWSRDFLLANVDGRFAKHEVQLFLMIGIGAIISATAFAFFLRMPKLTSAHLKIYTGAIITFVLFFVEVISLHRTDAFIYSIDGPFLRCGWIYAGAALLSTFGAIQMRSRWLLINRS